MMVTTAKTILNVILQSVQLLVACAVCHQIRIMKYEVPKPPFLAFLILKS